MPSSSTLTSTLLALALISGLFSPQLWADEAPTLTLDLAQPGAAVSPTFYGLMTEEINHSYDGGLYAELIRNRIFMNDNKTPAHWSLIQDGAGTGSISLENNQPVPNTALTTCLKLDAAQASAGHRVGIANEGYWGIPVQPKTTYRASFYAKADPATSGPLTASIESNDGAKVFATAQVPTLTNQWQKYSVTLTTGDDITPSATNRFVIATEKPGTLYFNLVSLFPPTFNDRPNGNRIDLMQMMFGMKPTFLRCPGGNYLEGNTIATRFPWKTSLHDLSQRPGHQACWNYRSTDGLGLLEFMEWCEDMQAQPVLAVYAGYSLNQVHVNPGPDLQPFVDEALDEIEYVTGDVSTKWGAERAKDGHPAPFKVTYVEIGNEDWFDKAGYEERFIQFHDAIKAKYPNLQLIATAALKSLQPDVLDNHYYCTPDEMESYTHFYDKTSRTGTKIFIGEWASRTGAFDRTDGVPTPDLRHSLSDAAWLTGLERNADVVIMQCYAPLLVNVNKGAVQWIPDLIGYDALTAYGSPSYYVQKMFSTHLGNVITPITSENIPTRTYQPRTPEAKPNQLPPAAPAPEQVPTLFFVATKDSAQGTVYLKLVNTARTPQPVQIHLNGATTIQPEGTAITLSSASPDDTNTITDPTKIVPVTEKISGLSNRFNRTLAPYSVTVLQIETK